MDTVWW